MGKKRFNRASIYLPLIDIFLITISWITSYWLRFLLNNLYNRPINPFYIYINTIPLIVLIWLFVYSYFGLYHSRKHITNFEELHSILKAVVSGGFIIMAISFLFKEYDFGRLVVIFSLILNFIFLSISRHILQKKKEREYLYEERDSILAVIIGAGITGIMAMQKLLDHPEIGYHIIGFLDNDPKKIGTMIGKVPVLGRVEDLKEVIKENKVDEVFIAIPSLPHKQILEMIIKTEETGVDFKVVTDLCYVLTGNASVDVIEDMPVVDFKNSAKTNSTYEMGIRIFDLMLAIIGIIIILPLWISICIAIKLDSKGDILFRQERVGKNEKIFNMYKFRTMYSDVNPYQLAPKEKDDPRITKVGKILRRSSLDELPQLINVIKGDMSIIGPRPEMPFIVANYEEWQKKRFEAKPGITGLWQILGRKDLPLHQNLEYDFYYIKNRSLLLDITILLKTIPAILFKKGAY